MTYTAAFHDIVDKPEWRSVAISPNAQAAGVCICKDLRVAGFMCKDCGMQLEGDMRCHCVTPTTGSQEMLAVRVGPPPLAATPAPPPDHRISVKTDLLRQELHARVEILVGEFRHDVVNLSKTIDNPSDTWGLKMRASDLHAKALKLLLLAIKLETLSER